MKKILAIILLGLIAIVGLANAADFDALIKKTTKQSPDGATTLPYEKISLTSKGLLVGRTPLEGIVTKDTKVVMGKYSEQKKVWEPAAAVPGGLDSDIFKNAPTTMLQVLVQVADDRKTIQQIIVKQVGGELTQAGPDYDGIIRDTIRGGIAVSKVELDDQWNVLKTFGIRAEAVGADTVIAMGKYNEQKKEWEAGEPIEGGLKNEMFKDPGKKTIYAHFISRDDKRGVTHILITKIGAPLKK